MSNTLESKIYAPNIEKGILAALIHNNNLINIAIEKIKSSEYFYNSYNKVIYKAILDLFQKGHTIDLVTLTDYLKKHNKLEDAGGISYITEIVSDTISVVNFDSYTELFLEKYTFRQLWETSLWMQKEISNKDIDARDLMQDVEQKIFELSQLNIQKGFIAVSDIVDQTLDTIENIATHSDAELIHTLGLPTGFVDLDNLIVGLLKNELLILAARPSMGKTAFALNLTLNAAEKYNVPVAFFSLEMDAMQLVERLLSSLTFINLKNLRSGHVSKEDRAKLAIKGEVLKELPIYIDDTPGQSILEIRSKARRIVNEKNVGLIIIDYLQLIHSHYKTENRQLEISMISRSLKEMAKELSVPILALAQLSRAVEQRGGRKKPLLSDLRESGSIEQDADVVLFLYRGEVYGFTTDETGQPLNNTAEIIVGKNRNGPIGSAKLIFRKDVGKFENFYFMEENSTPISDQATDQAEESPFI